MRTSGQSIAAVKKRDGHLSNGENGTTVNAHGNGLPFRGFSRIRVSLYASLRPRAILTVHRRDLQRLERMKAVRVPLSKR
jgi:hypothetical protein